MRRNKKQKKSFVVTLCLLLTMVLGIGYAVLSQQLSINGGLEYGTMKWDVGFKSATDGGGTINSNPTIASDKKSITITCDIGTSTASETCIANAVIANNSTFAVQLEANPTITYDSIYVKSIDAIWSEDSKSIVKSDTINAESTKEIKISIVTNELSSDMLPSESLTVPITITMNWVEKNETINDNVVLLSNEDFITGCYYNNGTLKTGSVFDKIKTTESFIPAQKIRVVVEDSANDVSSQPYKVVYSAYDSSGKILNPNNTATAMFAMENGVIELDLPILYPTASKFRVDILMLNGNDFLDIPSTAKITVYLLEESQEILVQSKFENKKIDILGDSITSQAKYIAPLKELTKASSIVNHGSSGQTTAQFVARVNNLDTDADLIIVFGGTNDYWHHDTAIGTISDSTNETFYGSLNMIYDALTTSYSNAEYLFIFPPHQTYDGKDDTYDWGYGTLNDFRVAMQTFTSNKGLKFLDLGTVDEWDPATHTSDGVHPNDSGGALLANSIYDFLQNNF